MTVLAQKLWELYDCTSSEALKKGFTFWEWWSFWRAISFDGEGSNFSIPTIFFTVRGSLITWSVNDRPCHIGVYMGKSRHGSKIKGDTPFLIMQHWDTSISYHATLGHKHKIWDPCIPLHMICPNKTWDLRQQRMHIMSYAGVEFRWSGGTAILALENL